MNFRNINILFFFIALLFISCSESNPTIPQEDHFEATGVILKSNNAILLKACKNEFAPEYDDMLNLALDEELVLDVSFTGDDCQELDPPDDIDKSLSFVITDGEKISAEISEQNRWQLKLKGLSIGTTTIEIQIVHAGHPDFKSPLISVTVTE